MNPNMAVRAYRSIKSNLFNLITLVILLIFAGTWAYVLITVLQFDPQSNEPQQLGTGLVLAAGILATTIGTQAAAALGFAVADVKSTERAEVPKDVATAISGATYAAVIVYLLVGIAVFAVWLFRENTAPELVSAFSLSLLGWLVGAAGVIFKPLSNAPDLEMTAVIEKAKADTASKRAEVAISKARAATKKK